jgi:hypothetical protein
MAIREGKWKCPGCGTVNRGAEVQCQACGATRDANVKFFLDEDAPEVADEAQLKKAQAGADWLCDFCGNASSQLADKCTSCGAPKGKKVHKSGDVVPLAGQATPPPVPQDASNAAPKVAAAAGMSALVMGGIFFALLLCCVTGAFFMFRTHKEHATVTQVSWERRIDVEDFVPTKKESWDTAPAGAREITHRREVHHTEQVQRGTHTEYKEEQVSTKKVRTGSKDLGNGHFEDVYKDEPVMGKVAHEVPTMVDEPVYREKYYYTIDEWHVTRTEKASGKSEPPAWPNVSLRGKEKENARHEHYMVTFSSKSVPEKTLLAPTQAAWEGFKQGSSWDVEFNNAGEFKVLNAQGQVVLDKVAK